MYNVIENPKIIDRKKEIAIVLRTKSISNYHIRRMPSYYYITVNGGTKLQINAAIEVLVKQGYRIASINFKNKNKLKVFKTINSTQYNPKNKSSYIASIVVAPPQPTGPLTPLPDPDGNTPIIKRKRRGKKK